MSLLYWTDLLPALPEIFLALVCLILTLTGAFKNDKITIRLTWYALLCLSLTVILVSKTPTTPTVTFNGLFVVDDFVKFIKYLILLSAFASLILYLSSAEQEKIERFEYPLLVLFSTLGMLMMASTHDLMSLFVSLELQSLSLYVLTGIKRDVAKSSEAALKYFVLGALSSGILLYGCSLIYGFTGTTNFNELAHSFKELSSIPPLSAIIGLSFIGAGLAFKISAVPFHMWTPDVYEGASTPVTAFLASSSKVAAFALMIKVLFIPFGAFIVYWRPIVIVIAAASMILGAFAALYQYNIKRLLAYSSIGHVGYALMGILSKESESLSSVLVYLSLYLIMTVGIFTIIIGLNRSGKSIENIDDLKGLALYHPRLALTLAIFMFSMAGIPPFAGFFAKFYIFMAALKVEFYSLTIIGALTSVVAAYYYLKIIKIMYFDTRPSLAPGQGTTVLGLQFVLKKEGIVLLIVTVGITLFYCIYPMLMINSATQAALSLTSGL